jgi:hypothetical protein
MQTNRVVHQPDEAGTRAEFEAVAIRETLIADLCSVEEIAAMTIAVFPAIQS